MEDPEDLEDIESPEPPERPPRLDVEEVDDVEVQDSEQGIEEALQELQRLTRATAKLAQRLDELGMGEAARAVLGTIKPEDREPQPEPAPPVVPVPPLVKPQALKPQQPAQPSKPLKPPKKPQPVKKKKKDDSPILQGSKIYIPLMERKAARRVLWDEWIRAGIGKLRGKAGAGEVDAAGRARGPVLNPDELEYLPDVMVVVPGRDGHLLVPTEAMLDEEEFEDFLDQWGVGDRISIEVEGMHRSEGPVVKGVYIAEPEEDGT